MMVCLVCSTLPMLCDCAHAVPHCPIVLCSVCTVSPMLCMSSVSCRRRVVGNGGQWQVPSQIGVLTNAYQRGDQTKNQVILHEEHPTNPYQVPVLAARNPLGDLAWCRRPYQPLPSHRSGLTGTLPCHYQSLPAAVLNTHTMISAIVLYTLIVAGLAYASYLKRQLKR